MSETMLVGWRKATPKEAKEHSAEVVFTREDKKGRQYTIYGCQCYESWEQWGEISTLPEADYQLLKAYRERKAENDAVTQRLKTDLTSFEHIDRDSQGEILAGGNTYLSIHWLAPKLVLSYEAATGVTIAQESR